jgi:DNA mismatch endonuclease (patch repair protein)
MWLSSSGMMESKNHRTKSLPTTILPNQGPPSASSDAARRRMLATRRRDTNPELKLRSALHRVGLRFRVDWKIAGTRKKADIAFPSRRVAIFVDGCFWHCCPIHGTWPRSNSKWWRAKLLANVRRDRAADHALKALGWTVVRVWEHQESTEACERVMVALRRRERRLARNSLHPSS